MRVAVRLAARDPRPYVPHWVPAGARQRGLRRRPRRPGPLTSLRLTALHHCARRRLASIPPVCAAARSGPDRRAPRTRRGGRSLRARDIARRLLRGALARAHRLDWRARRADLPVARSLMLALQGARGLLRVAVRAFGRPRAAGALHTAAASGGRGAFGHGRAGRRAALRGCARGPLLRCRGVAMARIVCGAEPASGRLWGPAALGCCSTAARGTGRGRGLAPLIGVARRLRACSGQPRCPAAAMALAAWPWARLFRRAVQRAPAARRPAATAGRIRRIHLVRPGLPRRQRSRRRLRHESRRARMRLVRLHLWRPRRPRALHALGAPAL